MKSGKNIKPFSKWTIDQVEDEFSIVLQEQNKPLDDWLSFHTEDNSIQTPTELLNDLRRNLTTHVHSWNEAELRIKFIAPLLQLINFDNKYYQSFFERVLSVPYKNETLSGDVDFLVARGTRVPKQPYFFLHEHKREADSSGDPLGQLMVTMIAAQMLNQAEYPLYGAYIIGRQWFFVLLDKSDYGVSLAYDATKDEIYDIFQILSRTKEIIEQLARELNGL